MVAAPDIWLKVLQNVKGVAIVSIDAGIFLRMSDLITGIETGAVREYDLIRFPSFNERGDSRR